MNNKETNYGIPLAFITLLFFMWGFITCLNDILIPHFKHVFTLTYFESMLIQFAFFGAYFLGSIIYFIISTTVGDPINKIGYKNGIIFGLGISALGTFLFYPAAEMVSFGFFLTALFVLALGFTLLQIAANPYVTMLGKPETGSQRLSLAGAINSFGTTIAPIIGGVLLLSTAAQSEGVEGVKKPYLFLSALFVVLMIVFKLVKLPDFSNKETIEKGSGALKYPQLVLGIGAIFFYVGGEVTVGSFMSNFVQLPEIKGVSVEQSTLFVTLYWGSLMIGRFTDSITVFNLSPSIKKILTAVIPVATFFFILFMIKVKAKDDAVFTMNEMMVYIPFIIVSILAFYIGNQKPARTLLIFSLLCIVLLVLTVTTSGELAMWSAISVGLYNSIMWPAIFSLAIAGLGKHTSQGSSLLIMAILGGALIPPLQGLLADAKGVQFSFIVPIICYIYLAYYGWKSPLLLKKQNIDLEGVAGVKSH